MSYQRKIEASWELLLEQASKTTEDYLDSAVCAIDQRLGVGYAKEHSELIAAFMQTAASDLRTSALLVIAQNLGESLGESLGEAVVKVLKDINMGVENDE